MSRKGDCWDNACVESFFHSLKFEAELYEPMMNRDQMREMAFEYIEVDYNRACRHSSLGYVSPERYELAEVALSGVYFYCFRSFEAEVILVFEKVGQKYMISLGGEGSKELMAIN